VEKEHEDFFLGVIAGHRLLPLMNSIFKWGLAKEPDAKPAPEAVYEVVE
jgi:hypothetical protein